jgi:voltage-gated sodium channel
MRNLFAKILSHPYFERTVLVAIVVNAAVLGLETYVELHNKYLTLFHAIDIFFVAFFCLELTMRYTVHRNTFFKDAWNIFDCFIVLITLFPLFGNVSVLRSLRILRALRVVSISPALRKVVAALFQSMRDFAAVLSVLMLVTYVYAVIASKLFGSLVPEYFGDIGKSLLTLFQIITLDSWTDIVRPLSNQSIWAIPFFVSFIVITVFMLLSIIVGIAANAIHREERG